MPKEANSYSKTGPSIPPDDDEDDNRAASRQTTRIVPAAGVPRPATTGFPSIFAAWVAAMPKDDAQGDAKPDAIAPAAPAPKAAAPRKRLDVAAVEIKLGVPVPQPVTGIAPIYASLWARMPVGSMVELSDRQAHGLAAHIKKVGGKYAIRKLGEDRKGVWSLA